MQFDSVKCLALLLPFHAAAPAFLPLSFLPCSTIAVSFMTSLASLSPDSQPLSDTLVTS